MKLKFVVEIKNKTDGGENYIHNFRTLREIAGKLNIDYHQTRGLLVRYWERSFICNSAASHVTHPEYKVSRVDSLNKLSNLTQEGSDSCFLQQNKHKF